MLNKLKHIIFIIIFIFLLTPLIEGKLRLVKFSPLEGVAEKTKKLKLNNKTWFDCTFQDNYIRQFEENMPFRNWLIRLRNQLLYSLFSETNASKIVIGKEGYLYEKEYIDTYLGKNYIGEESMKMRLKQLEILQNVLESQGKDLLLVIAPGKASFYPEYLPSRFKKPKNCKTNYDLFNKLINDYKINSIDFQKLFIEKKKISPYPLFPKCGIHWSYYGMSLVSDSLIRYIEQLRKINLPDLTINKYITAEIPQNPDYDLGNLLNIIFKIKQPTLYYPVYTYNSTDLHTKPKVLFIGDSFYWNLYYDSIPQRLFDNTQFWYYSNSIYPQSFTSPLNVSQIDVKSEIGKQDIIIIMFTEFRLANIGYGFVDLANNALNINCNPSDDIVKAYMLRIKSDTNWMKDIARKAEKSKIPLEKQLKMDAEWMLKQEKF